MRFPQGPFLFAMSYFEEPTHISSLKGESKISIQGRNILSITDKVGLQQHDIFDRKCLVSFSSSDHQRFSLSPVCIPGDQDSVYFTALKNSEDGQITTRTLLYWSTHSGVTKATEKKLKKDVFDAWYDEKSTIIYILYFDGEVEYFSTSFSSTGVIQQAIEGSKLLWSEHHISEGKILLSMMYTLESKFYFQNVSILEGHSKIDAPIEFSFGKGEQFISAAVNKCHSTLVVQTSAGRCLVYRKHLKDEEFQPLEPVVFIKPFTISCGITFISDDCVALCRISQEGFEFLLWETKYGSIQAEMVIALENVNNLSTYKTFKKITCLAMKSRIIISIECTPKKSITTEIFSIGVGYSPINMSSILSSGAKTKQHIKSHFCGINGFSGVIQWNPVMNWHTSKQEATHSEEKLLKQFSDSSISKKKFEDTFFKLTSSTGENSLPSISFMVLNQACQKSIQPDKSNPKEFFSRKVLEYILMHGLASRKCFPDDFVTLLFSHSEWNLLKLVVSRMQDLSEKDMVSIMEKLMALIPDVPEVKLPYPKDAEHELLLYLLSAPATNDDIIPELKKLPVNAVISLFKWLAYFVQKELADESESLLSIEQLISLLSNMIDAHFTQFVLTPDLHDIVLSIHKMIQEEMVVQSEFSSVQGFLNQLFQKRRVQFQEKQRYIGMNVRSIGLHKRAPRVQRTVGQGDYIVQYVNFKKLIAE